MDKLIPAYIVGGGDTLLCGECRFTIALCVDMTELGGAILICPRCNCENVIFAEGNFLPEPEHKPYRELASYSAGNRL